MKITIKIFFIFPLLFQSSFISSSLPSSQLPSLSDKEKIATLVLNTCCLGGCCYIGKKLLKDVPTIDYKKVSFKDLLFLNEYYFFNLITENLYNIFNVIQNESLNDDFAIKECREIIDSILNHGQNKIEIFKEVKKIKRSLVLLGIGSWLGAMFVYSFSQAKS